jgi:serine/threonine-protein kinase
MDDASGQIAEPATQGSTIVEPAMEHALEPLSSVPWPSASSFPDLELEAEGRKPIDVLQRRRLWWLSLVIPGLSGVAMLSLLALGGGVVTRCVFIAGMIAASAATLWMGWMARHRRRPVSVRAATVAWFVISGAGACSAILYFGAFSPALMVAVLAVFFVATRDDLVVALTAYLTIAVFHAVLAAIVIGGGVPDPGVFPLAPGAAGRLVVLELVVQSMLFATLLAGGAIRRSMAGTVRDLEQRARSLGHHELLLEDARRAFEASLRATGGGRFSHQIVGSYRLGQLLGEGAMGEVYEALDVRTGSAAAVKLLRREAIEDRRIILRFLTEARIVGSLHSGHIVRVLETAEPGSGLPYIAMERLHGQDLRQYRKAQPDGRLTLADVDDLLHQIARGIDAAHRAGIVHRDLKPSNLFRDATGTWKILDFGVSKVIGERTTMHGLVGTPSFMSPEQASGGAVDGRTDIFALGGIVYYMLSGTMAFSGQTLAESVFQVIHGTPPRLTTLVPGLPPDVDAAVMTALAKDPRRRFATATAFAAAFGDAIGGTRRAV